MLLGLLAAACGTTGDAGVDDAGGEQPSPTSNPESTPDASAPAPTSAPTPDPTATTESPLTLPPERPIEAPIWEPVPTPASGLSVHTEFSANGEEFLAAVTDVNEPAGPTTFQLLRWQPEVGDWVGQDSTLPPHSFHAHTFDGDLGAVPAFVEPEAEDEWITPGAVAVATDGRTWERRLIEQTPVPAADRYLSRTANVVDAGAVDGRIYALMDETTLFDRGRFVADRGLGNYTDWDIHDGNIRMWATRDHPEGPHRGKRPAVTLPLEEADLSPAEADVLAAQVDGRFDAFRRLRILWSDGGRSFMEAEAEPVIAHDPARLLVGDGFTAVVLTSLRGGATGGGVLLVSDDDGRSYRSQPLPPAVSRLDPLAVVTDGRLLYVGDTHAPQPRLHVSAPGLDGWVSSDRFPEHPVQVDAGPAGIAVVTWSGGTSSLHLSPDGVNWVAAGADELTQ
ncbi:MAG: hypothetical protein AAGK32_07290, partial [Actinomycetota bacterium]